MRSCQAPPPSSIKEGGGVYNMTFNSFFHTEQKNLKHEYLHLTSHRTFLTFFWHYQKFISFPDILAKFFKFLTIPDEVANLMTEHDSTAAKWQNWWFEKTWRLENLLDRSNGYIVIGEFFQLAANHIQNTIGRPQYLQNIRRNLDKDCRIQYVRHDSS